LKQKRSIAGTIEIILRFPFFDLTF